MKAAEFAVSHLNRISTSKHALILTQLKTRKHTQMASSMYNLTIKAGLSQDCLKDGRLISPDFCPDDYCRPNMTTAKYFQVQVLWQANAWYKVLGSAEFEPEEDERQFQIYILKYQKEYFNNAEEYEKRFIVFKDNLKEIERMKLLEKGTATHEVNAFADLSKEEFFSHHTMPQGWQETGIKLPLASELLVADIPPSFDWRTKGVVSEVKDQGNCGSCWAFSTTGNIEGQWAINCHKLYSLSEQELIDCDTMDQGCNGGLPSIAYQQVMKIGGLVTESQYPYTAYSGHCQLNKKEIVVNINGSLAISSDEDSTNHYSPVR
jgi:C1A family cysteine protease